ncbi:MAG TPA: hypothetical protein VIA10_07355 [Gaiellaceae bacterium]|jgi:hypothetical protein
MRLGVAVMGCIAVVLIAAGLRSAEGANSASFTDPTGDFVGGSPDVTAASIANDDSGVVTVTITVAASRPLVSGMRVGVVFNTDSNTGTGAPTHYGAEVVMQLDIASAKWFYFRWNGSAFEQVNSSTGSVSYTTSTATIRVNRSELSNTSALTFYVFGDAFNSATQRYDTDYGPADGSSWPYSIIIATPTTTTPSPATTAPPSTTTVAPPVTTSPPPVTTNQTTIAGVDSDRDGVRGAQDKCPKVRGGKYDRNKNGCPGPFSALRLPTADDLRPAQSSAGITRYSTKRNTIRGLAAGTAVLLQFGRDRELLRAGKAGTVRSRLLLRHGFKHGSAVEIKAWKAGWIGFAVRLVVRTADPYSLVTNRRCIAPTETKPRPCSQVSRGR